MVKKVNSNMSFKQYILQASNWKDEMKKPMFVKFTKLRKIPQGLSSTKETKFDYDADEEKILILKEWFSNQKS